MASPTCMEERGGRDHATAGSKWQAYQKAHRENRLPPARLSPCLMVTSPAISCPRRRRQGCAPGAAMRGCGPARSRSSPMQRAAVRTAGDDKALSGWRTGDKGHPLPGPRISSRRWSMHSPPRPAGEGDPRQSAMGRSTRCSTLTKPRSPPCPKPAAGRHRIEQLRLAAGPTRWRGIAEMHILPVRNPPSCTGSAIST